MTPRDYCDECPSADTCYTEHACTVWRRDRRPLSQLTKEEILDFVTDPPPSVWPDDVREPA